MSEYKDSNQMGAGETESVRKARGCNHITLYEIEFSNKISVMNIKGFDYKNGAYEESSNIPILLTAVM